MKIITFLSIIFCLTQSLSYANVVELKDGRKVNLKPDGTYKILNLPENELGSSVTIIGRFLEAHTSEYKQKSIRYMPLFKNSTQKTIIGIKFLVDFKNAFGESILETPFSGTTEQIIEPGSESNGHIFYKFEDNPFISNQPYDKLLPSVVGDTLKDKVEIKQIIYKNKD
jgi:hypothetical protein